MAGRKKKSNKARVPTKTHSVYVIELPPEVTQARSFKKQNPQYAEGSTCVYVGLTAKTVEERYKQHATGHKLAAKPCAKYGVKGLIPDLFEHLNPMKRTDGEKKEVALGNELRELGYGVWQK
jgi:hypothetical protein